MVLHEHLPREHAMDRLGRFTPWLLAAGCYVTILTMAHRTSYSSSGFLVFGLGSVLLIDKYFLRWLPWSAPVAWRKELAFRAAYFLLGSLGYALAFAGTVSLREVLYLGLALSLAAFVFECAVGLAASVVRRLRGLKLAPPRSWPRRIVARLLFFGFIVCILPLLALHLPCTLPARTPVALGLAFEDVVFTTSDGLQLAGWLVPHTSARGSVIFCHGHGANRGQVAGFLPALHAMGLNVLAFDFRGHGDSPGHTATFGHREIQDVAAAERFLYQRFPDRPILILGVSYGAAVALQALPQLAHVQAVWSEGCFSRLDALVANKLAWVPASLQGSCISLYNGLAWLDCGFSGDDINPIQQLRQAHVPICFCHGCGDELVPLAQAQALYDAYAGPKWKYWVAGANHDNASQFARREYVRRLRGFFEHVLAQHS
jgi:fermentation-respiration switch protein FrsA (DUF1100 family)